MFPPSLFTTSFLGVGDPYILSPSQSHGPPKFSHLMSATPNHSTPRLKSRHSIGAVSSCFMYH